MGLEYALDRDPYLYAVKKGLVVRLAAPNELLLDIDTAENLATFEKNYKRFHASYPLTEYVMTPSPSGEENHYHAAVTLAFDVTDMERLVMQAFLGSDLIRELLCWMRIKRGTSTVITCLFEKE